MTAMRRLFAIASALSFSAVAVACGEDASAPADPSSPAPSEAGASSSGSSGTDTTSSSGANASSSSSGANASSSSSGSSGVVPDPDGGVPEEGGTTPTEAEALCNLITPSAWSAADSDALLTGVVAGFAKLKRDNDALIDQRGVGAFAGSNTDTWKAIAAGDYATAAAILAPHLANGYDADDVAHEIAGTSCIGRVYRVLDEVYTSLGRGAEWDRIEACGRAWNSDGLHVQDALIRSGWRSPALPVVSDAVNLPGSADERAFHQQFLQAAAAGSYYGVPLSTTQRLQNFLPSPGSNTPRDTSMYSTLSTGTYLAFATLRAAYHVPVVVPGRFVPANLAPAGDSWWPQARNNSEPFVLESHSLREAWDKTNFEIRPLTYVIAETFESNVVYATGTLLFAPNGSFTP